MDDTNIRKQNWDIRETELLLDILKDLDMKKCLDGRKVRNDQLFKVAHRRMTAAGYRRSIDQLKIRWKVLKSAYYKCKRPSGAPIKIQGWWRYEDHMVAIMEARAVRGRDGDARGDSDGEASVRHWRPEPRPDTSFQSLDGIV